MNEGGDRVAWEKDSYSCRVREGAVVPGSGARVFVAYRDGFYGLAAWVVRACTQEDAIEVMNKTLDENDEKLNPDDVKELDLSRAGMHLFWYAE